MGGEMSEKHIPRHRRSYSKELATALQIVEYLKQKQAIYPSANIHLGEIADVIALGMKTAADADIPPTPISSSNLDDLIDSY
jgi:hypothetical protein